MYKNSPDDIRERIAGVGVVDGSNIESEQMDEVDGLKRNSAMKLASFPGHSSAANSCSFPQATGGVGRTLVSSFM